MHGTTWANTTRIHSILYLENCHATEVCTFDMHVELELKRTIEKYSDKKNAGRRIKIEIHTNEMKFQSSLSDVMGPLRFNNKKLESKLMYRI